MEDIFFNVFLFMIAFSFCWFVTKTFLKSLREFWEWLFPKKDTHEEEKQDSTLSAEEKEIEDFDFNEKMKKGYLTQEEKEIFRKKFLKK